MVLLKESVWSLKEYNNTTLVFLLSNWLQVLKLVYDWPVQYHFWRFRFLMIRL